MKTINRFVGLAVCCSLLQLISCTKTNDNSGDAAGVATSNQATSPAKKCRIASFTQTVPGMGIRNVEFFYNKHGQIDSAIADLGTGSLGAHLFYFTYDKNHKLIGYREDAGEFYPFQEVHTYVYEQGRIARDSVRINPDGTFTEVQTFEYDKKGRLIKATPVVINDDGSIIDNLAPYVYTYDDDGNLVVDAAAYDDGVNFLSLSEELMFTQRDYSRNNRLGATGYNDSGLPLGFADGIWASYGASSLLTFGLPDYITYDCK